MKKNAISGFFLFAVLMLTAACSKEKVTDTEGRRVLTQTVTGSNAANATTYPGRTQASEEANVAFRVAGTLLRVTVKEGDHVRRGQVIARMDDRDYRVQLAAAEAQYTQVKAEAERVISLYADSVGTANNYDKARYGLQQMEQKLQHCRDLKSQTRQCLKLQDFQWLKLQDCLCLKLQDLRGLQSQNLSRPQSQH